ncbi:hypothetical protein QZH41_017607 [Actinostola sp. cb2023]|nr:hypothetical protein QZH41_017607 [Actinostola sp. cb2023]
MAVSPYVSRAEIWLANSSFRSSFKLPEYFHPSLFLKWFPGHMAKGLRVMQSVVRKCDCVLEVHDAREIQRRLESKGTRTVLIDCKAQYSHTVKKIIPTIMEAIKDAEYEGSYIRKDPDAPYTLLVCGLPNTGKSSLINAMRRTHLRKGKATRVGKAPGITTALQERILVADEPKMYILDTPGVVSPYIPTAEVGMKLAAIGKNTIKCCCFKDHFVGEDLIADFILFNLNKNGKFEYVRKFGLENPSDSINFVLRQLAVSLNSTVSGGVPNYLQASIHLMSRFRRGELGRIILDQCL